MAPWPTGCPSPLGATPPAAPVRMTRRPTRRSVRLVSGGLAMRVNLVFLAGLRTGNISFLVWVQPFGDSAKSEQIDSTRP